MNELINAAKDQAAREIEGYYGKWRDWQHLVVDGDMNEIEAVINRAMEIYAEGVVKSKKKKSKINPYEPTGFKAINSKTTKP